MASKEIRYTGLPAEKLHDAARVAEQLDRELLFTPGSQPRITIHVDELSLLLRAARDGFIAHSLYEALVPAEKELIDTGVIVHMPEIGKVLSKFTDIHPELMPGD